MLITLVENSKMRKGPNTAGLQSLNKTSPTKQTAVRRTASAFCLSGSKQFKLNKVHNRAADFKDVSVISCRMNVSVHLLNKFSQHCVYAEDTVSGSFLSSAADSASR